MMTSTCLVSTNTAAPNTSSWYVALPLVLSAALGGMAPQIADAQVDCSTADTDRVSCAERGTSSTGWSSWWQSFDSGAVADRAVETVSVEVSNGGASSADGIYLEVFSSNSTPNACNPGGLGTLVGTSASRSIPDTNNGYTAVDFTFPATTELSPNTTYYIKLVDPTPDGGDQGAPFSENRETGSPGGAGNNCGEMAHAVYMQAADADGDGVPNTEDPYPYDATNPTPATPVPALSGLILLLLALGAIALGSLRRRKIS